MGLVGSNIFESSLFCFFGGIYLGPLVGLFPSTTNRKHGSLDILFFVANGLEVFEAKHQNHPESFGELCLQKDLGTKALVRALP